MWADLLILYIIYNQTIIIVSSINDTQTSSHQTKASLTTHSLLSSLLFAFNPSLSYVSLLSSDSLLLTQRWEKRRIKQDLKRINKYFIRLKDSVSLSFMGATLQFQGGQVLGFKRKVYGAVNRAQFSFPFQPHKVVTVQ